MIHRGVTVRALLAVIALLAVGVAVYRERIRRSNIVAVYIQRAEYHSQFAKAIDRRRRTYRELLDEARTPEEIGKLRKEVEKYEEFWGYHAKLAASYRDAASHPWFSGPVHPRRPRSMLPLTFEESLLRHYGVEIPPASAPAWGESGGISDAVVIDVDRDWLDRLASGTAPWGLPWRDGPIDPRVVAIWQPSFPTRNNALTEVFGETGLVNDARLRYTVEDLSLKGRDPTAAREPYTSGRILIADMKRGRLWCARWRRSKPR